MTKKSNGNGLNAECAEENAEYAEGLEALLATEIELDKRKRADAIASLKRYFEENLPEPIGDLPAGMLLDFFLEEIGPAVYNKAVSDASTRMQQRVADLDGELFVDEFGYWAKGKKRR